MAPRIQSPSSINYFKMCPRCYYYRYIKKIQFPTTIHLIRGNIVHSALEDFFKLNINGTHKDHHEIELNIILQSIFRERWEEKKGELDEIGLNDKQQEFYFKESVDMINNWFNRFISRVLNLSKKMEFKKAFNIIKPETEIYFKSEEHMVQGYIDAIEKIDNEISLIDYKTSRKDDMTEDYKLQLAIYALLYKEKYGVEPKTVGIDFLRHNKKFLEVNQDLIDLAIKECKNIQEKTQTENIEDYRSSNHPYCNCNDYEEIIERTTLDKFTN